MNKKYISIIFLVILSLILVSCNSQGGEGLTNESDGLIEITDMADRQHKIPEKINKIMSTDSVGTIIIYTINPDKMVGWNYDLKEGEKQYIDEKYHDLPNLGGAGKSPLNHEELLKIDPDILVAVGEIDKVNIEKMDDLQEKLNKPVIMLESDMNMLAETYEFLGQIMGEESAKDLAKYCRETMDNIGKGAKTIKEEDRVTLYYAEGPNGLETEPSNSWHGQVIDLIGGKNVAEVEINKDTGKSEINLEQLILWNPDLIISWADERGGYYSGILEDESWKDISAVKNKKVYEIPNRPFNWFDRPPSVNRVLGIRWLGNLLYPEIYKYDIREEVKEFYEMFYHYTLSDQEIDELLDRSI